MSPRSASVRALTVVVGTLAVAGLSPAAPARAGEWVQVVCANPDGSAAPSEGFSGYALGSPPPASQANPRCTPQAPMQVSLFSSQPAPAGSEEVLQYTPPAGSTLAGGTLQVHLFADGYGSYVGGSAGVLEPAVAQTPPNTVKLCVQSQHLCQNGSDDFAGAISLPADAGGDLFLVAGCDGFNRSGSCDTGGSQSTWAMTQLDSAQLLLRNASSPQAADVGGSILGRRASGDASLTLAASDPGGPGVYTVLVAIDGHAVYAGTPADNGGACRAVGQDAATGALMFDYQQPCPTLEPVSVSVPTTGFHDGRHTLTATVVDAAGNSAQVLSQSITIRNSGSTQARLPRLRVRMVFYWRWSGKQTRLVRTVLRRAPRRARAAVACRGRGCPAAVRGLRGPIGSVLRRLAGLRLRRGDRLTLTFTAPGRRAEQVTCTIRVNRLPAIHASR